MVENRGERQAGATLLAEKLVHVRWKKTSTLVNLQDAISQSPSLDEPAIDQDYTRSEDEATAEAIQHPECYDQLCWLQCLD